MITKRIKVKREFCNAENKYRLFLYGKGMNCLGKLGEETEQWIKDNDKIEVSFNGTHWGIFREEIFYPIYNCLISIP